MQPLKERPARRIVRLPRWSFWTIVLGAPIASGLWDHFVGHRDWLYFIGTTIWSAIIIGLIMFLALRAWTADGARKSEGALGLEAAVPNIP